jgi:hypothetical protein
MRGVLLACVVVVGGVAGGQPEPAFDGPKELDRKAKAALDVLKKRGDGYLDKSAAAFEEVIARSDPNNAPSQRVAGQAVFFLNKLYAIKEAAAVKAYQEFGTDEKANELSKVRREMELWAKTARTAPQDAPTLEKTWLVIQRDWTLEDLKKK